MFCRFAVVCSLLFFLNAAHAIIWQSASLGIEFAITKSAFHASRDSVDFVVVRINPTLAPIKVYSNSSTKTENQHSSAAWCRAEKLRFACNAGMFATDYKTHVGYLRHDGHVNSSRRAGSYQSVVALHPKRPELPPFHIYDTDETPFDTVLAKYRTIVQNLRLIKRPKINRWEAQSKKSWSEIALAEDSKGNMLFVFSPDRLSMYEFNELLLALPLDVVTAQHLEGGSEVQMTLKRNGVLNTWIGGSITPYTTDEAAPIPFIFGAPE